MQLNRRGLMLAAAAAFTGVAGRARADLFADLTAGAKPLRVGTDATFPPFEQTAADGAKSGFDIDLVTAAAQRAGIKSIDIQQVPFGQLVPGLMADHIDLAISAIYITPERAKVVDFSRPYFTGGLCAMLKPDETGITKPEDLNGKTVAVQVGTKSVAFLQQNFPNATLRIAQTNDQMFQSLQSRQADAVVTGLPAAKYYIKVHGGAKLAPFTLTHEQYGIAVRKTDTALRDAIDAALSALDADGSLKALEAKWFG